MPSASIRWFGCDSWKSRSPTCTTPPAICAESRRRFGEEWGLEGLRCDLEVLETLQAALRSGDWRITVAVHGERDIVRGVARPEGSGVRGGRRRRVDDDRGARLRPHLGRGGGVGRRHEPADPVRRGPHEPGLVRDDEPGRGAGDDRRGTGRGAGPAPRGGGAGRRGAGGDPGSHPGRQPDHAPPPARPESGRAGPGAVRADRRPCGRSCPRARSSWACTPGRGCTCCPAWPGTWAPTAPASSSPRRRTCATRSTSWWMSAPMPRSCSATGSGCSRRRAPPVRRSRAPR